jgi:ATP synthase protein I
MKRWQAPLQLLGVGWFISLCIVLGILGGLWLDGKAGTSPLFTVVGLFLGLAFAVFGVYRMLIPLLNKKNNKKDS